MRAKNIPNNFDNGKDQANQEIADHKDVMGVSRKIIERLKYSDNKLFNGTPREKTRIKRILKKIDVYWESYPDMRFMQLISNFESSYSQKHNNIGKVSTFNKRNEPTGTVYDLFYVEDTDFEAFLDDFILNRITKNNKD